MTVNRIFYLDYLKAFLCILVVFHHAALPYVEGVSWHVLEQKKSVFLEPFIATNAGFFMALFFFISGYFIPGSYKKRAVLYFVKDKFIRFSIPLILFFFIIIPITLYYGFYFSGILPDISFYSYYTKIFFWDGASIQLSKNIYLGQQWMHLWFLIHLFFYILIYSALRVFLIKHPSSLEKISLNFYLILFFILLLGITFLIRLSYPIGYWSSFLSFIPIEFAHLPQYIAFFFLGTLSYSYKLLDKLSYLSGRKWLIIGITLAVLRLFQIYLWDINPWHLISGSFSFQGFIYCLWETVLCVSLSIGLLSLFKEYLNKKNNFLLLLSKNSYSVYLFHMPIVTFIQIQLLNFNVKAEIKFIIVGIISVVLSFLFSHFLVRKTPFLNKLL